MSLSLYIYVCMYICVCAYVYVYMCVCVFLFVFSYKVSFLDTSWECARDCNILGLQRMIKLGRAIDTKGALFNITPLHSAILGQQASRILLEFHIITNKNQNQNQNKIEKEKDVRKEKEKRISQKTNSRSVFSLAQKALIKIENSSSSLNTTNSIHNNNNKKQQCLALGSTLDFLLKTCKVYVDSRDYHGRTPLMYSPVSGISEPNAIKLIRAGADINAIDSFGNTPLHYAYAFCGKHINSSRSSSNNCWRNNSSGSGRSSKTSTTTSTSSTLVSLFLAAGASPCTLNNAGESPKSVMGFRKKILQYQHHDASTSSNKHRHDRHDDDDDDDDDYGWYHTD